VKPETRDDILRLHQWLLSSENHGAGALAVGAEMCRRLTQIGVPIARAHVLVLVLHPLYHGRSYLWEPVRGAWAEDHAHGVQDQDGWTLSPFKAMIDGQLPARARFELTDPAQAAAYPVLEAFRQQGMTDYFAIRLTLVTYDEATRHAMSFCTRAPGGFSDEHLEILDSLERILSVRLESVMRRELAEIALTTYLGADPAERVLRGQIRRGDVEYTDTVLWFSDLRDYTFLSEHISAEALLDLLGDYFEVVSDTVRQHGGVVLKFIGDAVLAVFHYREGEVQDACIRAAAAARAVCHTLDGVVRERTEHGKTPFEYGIALHVGQVIYGNIGAADRLDFTVVGPAVNLAARIEDLCRPLKQRMIASDDFAQALGQELQPLGTYALKGVETPMRLYAVSTEGPTPD